jgi:DNA segregation ATPase FtsK/SpoIIIE-like protein
VHGPFVSDEEVEKVVRHLKTQGQPEYLEAVTAGRATDEDGAVFDATGMGAAAKAGDDLYARRWRSSSATARPPPATSSAGCRSATTAPRR